MDFMNQPGFFGTRAPMFMDIVSLIVLFLPFLMYGIISLAKMKNYTLHAALQKTLFVVSLFVLGFFEVGVRMAGGFKAFMQESGVAHDYAVVVMVFHIFISVSTILIWITTLFRANKMLQEGETRKHRKFGYLTFFGVVMVVLTGAWVYMLLFVY